MKDDTFKLLSAILSFTNDLNKKQTLNRADIEEVVRVLKATGETIASLADTVDVAQSFMLSHHSIHKKQAG